MGNVSRPTWTAPSEYNYTTSMTAIIKVDLSAQYPALASDFILKDQDIVAAFSDDKCLGIASQENKLFFLYVTGTEGAVTIRNYSAFYSNIFEAKDAFEFKNDAQLGTIANPYKPAFTVKK